jgi:hypothetical protein
LQYKDCGVGQSIFFSLISEVLPSAEEIEQHVTRSAYPDLRAIPLGELGRVRSHLKGLGTSVSLRDRKGSKAMPLITILITLIVVGVLLWLVNRFIPMAGSIKSILNGVVVIGVVLWLLNVFGLFHSLSRIRVG